MNIIQALQNMKDIVQQRAAEYLQSLDRVIELYRTDLPADAQYLSQSISQAAQPENLPRDTASPAVKPSKRMKRARIAAGPAAPARPWKATPRATSPPSESLFSQATEAVGSLDEPFGAAALAAAVPGLKQIRAADYLNRMLKGSVLLRVGYGKYTRMKGRLGPAPADHTVTAPKSDYAPPPREAKPNSLAAAVLEIAGRAPEPFTLLAILPQLKAHPNCQKTGDEKIKITAAAFLQELRSRDWLERVGTDRPTAYRRTKLFPAPSSSASTSADRYADLPGNPVEALEEDEPETLKQR
jgi:hypothetical protein